jgi:hypothetical protein
LPENFSVQRKGDFGLLYMLRSNITTFLGYYWQKKILLFLDIIAMSTKDVPSDMTIPSLFTHSASLANTSTLGPHHDFISFLAVAQRLTIDFLPITWQPALDSLGVGGTSEIRQSVINLHNSLAFKRNTLSTASEASRYQTLISEISILGHPVIRNHANVITLEGICWDISVDDESVWPVLVFEKTEHGDMNQFLNSDVGKRMCFVERLKLCADVATALMAMHSSRE